MLEFRIGSGHGTIDQVTTGTVEFTDQQGRSGSVDLHACALGWMQYHQEKDDDFVAVSDATPQERAAWGADCVGMRDALATRPWVVLLTEPRVRFEFESREDLYSKLLNPLRAAGWHTFDSG